MNRTLQLTSPSMRGEDVAYAKHLLHPEYLYSNPFLPLSQTTWDEEAAAAARRAKWALGYPEDKCRGTFGTTLERYLRFQQGLSGGTEPPLLYRRRAAARAKQFGVLAVREAELWVGTKEDPANSNIAKPFTPWYGWIGWGAPWCAVFVSYCLKQAGFKYIAPSESRWAFCPYVVRDAREGRYGLATIPASECEEGTIVLFDWDNDGVADHIGFATEPVKNGNVQTIEGNTSPNASGSQSNGGMVCRKLRAVSDIIEFVKAG